MVVVVVVVCGLWLFGLWFVVVGLWLFLLSGIRCGPGLWFLDPRTVFVSDGKPWAEAVPLPDLSNCFVIVHIIGICISF